MPSVMDVFKADPGLAGVFQAMRAIVEAKFDSGYRTIAVERGGELMPGSGRYPVFPRGASDVDQPPFDDIHKQAYVLALAVSVATGHTWVQLKTQDGEDGTLQVIAVGRDGKLLEGVDPEPVKVDP